MTVPRALAIGAAVLSAACAVEPDIVAEESILRQQILALERLVKRAEAGPLLPEGDLVVAVDEEWVREIIALELPRTERIANSYRVRVETAQVRFDDGLGLVRVDGRVSPAGDDSDRVFADLSVYGSLDVVELDPVSGVLRGRVSPLAFAVREVALLVVNPLGRQLVEALGREKIESFASLGLTIDIPVRLDQTIELPGVGPGGPVEFAGASLPLSLSVSAVTAIDGRLWVSVASRLDLREGDEAGTDTEDGEAG